MKKFHRDNKCSKCGQGATTEYDNQSDKIIRSCIGCGHRWEELPLDSSASFSEIIDLAEEFQKWKRKDLKAKKL